MAIYMGLDSSTQSLTAVVIEADGRDRQVLEQGQESLQQQLLDLQGRDDALQDRRSEEVADLGTAALQGPPPASSRLGRSEA